MKKTLLFTLLSSAVLFGFKVDTNKVYNCNILGVSYKEGNQTKSVAYNKATKNVIDSALGDLVKIELHPISSDEINITSGADKSSVVYKHPWRGYDQYVTKQKDLIFMPDKNATSTNAALIVPRDKLIIFYDCK